MATIVGLDRFRDLICITLGERLSEWKMLYHTQLCDLGFGQAEIFRLILLLRWNTGVVVTSQEVGHLRTIFDWLNYIEFGSV